MDPLRLAGDAAFSGLFAQSLRMKVVAQNIANSESLGSSPGADPYRRRTVTFTSELGRLTGGTVRAEVQEDSTPFALDYMPGHKASDAKGYVKTPNVNRIVEMTDMRQALRSYEANLQVVRQTREMAGNLIELLKSNG